MVSAKRVFTCGMISAGLIVIAVAGCNNQQEEMERSVQTPLELPNAAAVLPQGVELPMGFYPLAGHYNLDNPADHYNGWPRYILSEIDDMVMVYVPSQEIIMGGGTGEDEVPAREVTVNHFYIDLHEVTNGQFARFHKDVGDVARVRKQDNSWGEYWVPGLNDDYPVRAVSWWEAQEYGEWSEKTLPTEAQWEAAARGDDGRIYPWGNSEQLAHTEYVCNASTSREQFDGYEYTAPALNFAAGVSPFGAFNMSGNVWEWCSDYYDPGRYAYPSQEDPPRELERGPKAFGDRNYPNPKAKMIAQSRVGPALGGKRAIRGGSFADPIERCRTDVREAVKPGVRRNNIGFRCVLPLPPDEQFKDAG
jgi:formylglycine-generating enzyme required for sulfatase activity